MESSIFRISLDFHQQVTQTHLSVKKGDTAQKIVAALSNGGRPYLIREDCHAVFKGKKPDGHVLYNDCAIINNCIVYEFTEQTASRAGYMHCELQLYGPDGKIITSPKFAIIVSGLVYDDSEVESSDEFTALGKALTDLAELKANGLKGDPGPQGDPGPMGPQGELFRIHLFEVAAGNYEADKNYDAIKHEYEAGQQILCCVETEEQQWMELPLVKETNGVLEFGAIIGDTGWKALISRGEDGAAIVEVTSSVYGGPPVYVTMTGTEATGYQADCTYEMIKAAHEAKRTVYCVYNTTIMILAAVTESMVAFQTVYSKSTYRRAFIYADASQPPKTDMMKFVLAEDLKGKADLPKPTDEIYFDITDEGVLSLKPEYRGAYSGTSASSAPYWSDNGGKRDGTFNKELPEEIILPEDVDGVNVTALAAHMFHGNKRVKRIVLPSCIDAIPEGFCNAAVNLEEVANTEHIKTLGSHAFNTTSIRKAYFPGLIELPKRSNGNAATSHFANCANLVSADLGQVFTQPGAVIPAYCFSGCERLVRLQNAGGVTSIGDFGLYMTRRMKNPDFLPADQPHLCKLTSIGNYGLLLSRVNFDWNALPADAFGALSTPKQINTTDYSGCKFTARTNPLRSTFEQHDPRWANKNIGNCANTYSTGCATVAAAMIYSALMEVDMGSPEEFVAAVGAVDESLLDLDIANGTNDVTGGGDFWGELVRWFDAAGLKAVVYNSVSAANVQVMYDALANGALVWGRILADYNNENHCVVIHGVNGAGELLVTDSSAASRYIGVYEAATYTMPVRNFMRDHGDYVDHFLIVTKK